MTPDFRLTLDGTDLSDRLRPRLISLSLSDYRGLQADQLDITLSDHDGALEIPRRGVKLRLHLGWKGQALIDKGTYTVDEVEHSGSPDVLTIRARSADLKSALTRKRDQSFHAKTLGEILRTLTQAHGLTLKLDPRYEKQAIPHIDQTGESDINLIGRLAADNDAIATIKQGCLIFLETGHAKTASGKPMPHIELTRHDGDQHSYQEADRDAYTGVIATYYATDKAERHEAVIGDRENAKRLRASFADEQSALTAARAEWRRIQRGTSSFTYSLALGRPELSPEMTFSFTGLKEPIDAIVWLGASVTHELNDQGFTTRLDLQTQLPESEDGIEAPATPTGWAAWYTDKTGKEAKVTLGDQTHPRTLAHKYKNEKNARRGLERASKATTDTLPIIKD